MQDRIKELAEAAGFNVDPETGLILDTAGVYSVDDAVRGFAQAIARECAEIALKHPCEERSARCPQIADAIRARFGIASPTGDR